MEKLKEEFSGILAKYETKYQQTIQTKGGLEKLLNNSKNYSILFEEFVDEITLKSNDYTDHLKREDIIKLSQETILKFKFV